jgi:uncharacterized protein (DUF1015 family)
MAVIKPFRALRPANGLAPQVATLPYDVMNTKEAKQMAAGNPNSFLHVSRAEIDLPESIDIHSDEVYTQAAKAFRQLIENGTLLQEIKPCFYIYAQTMDGRRQLGLVASSSVEDYFNDVIKKHEFTRPEKEEDRIKHMQHVQAHVGPIFLTYPENKTIDALVEKHISSNPPIFDFTAEDGVQHSGWLVDNDTDIATIENIFATQVPYTYIADGHHRTASAAKVGKQLAAKNTAHTGNEEYNFFLSVLFPANQLAIMDYNRAVKDLNGHTPESFTQQLVAQFDIAKTDNCKPNALHQFGMYLEGQWYSLTAKPSIISSDPIGVLDVTILQDYVLNPLLGINDPRTDTRIDFIGGIRGMKALEERVDSGEVKVAFALYPVSLQQLIDIADSGNVMPPKSTWFEPKLRDGLFSHLF